MKQFAFNTFYILKYFKKDKVFPLIFLMILVSMLELIGISLVIPFVTSIIDPNYIDGKFSLYLKAYIDIEKFSSFSNILILIILAFYVFKNLFVIFVVAKQWRYSMNLITLLRIEFFKRYLNQPYIKFIKQDHSELISNIMNVTSTFGSTFIVNLLVFMSELMICFSLIVFLFVFNFKLTFLLMIIFLIIIFIYYKYISNRLKIAGLRRVESDEKIIDYSKLSFQNMKELKLFNKQDFFIKKFTQSAFESEESNFFYQVSAQYPRIGMEIFAILGICVLTLVMNYLKLSSLEIITTLAFYGVSIFRILPSANKLMFAFQSVRFAKESQNIVYKELISTDEIKNKNYEIKEIIFSNEIKIDNLKFKYPNKDFVLNELNFNIKKGSFVGIKGKSGVGKTTLLDLLMGLIKPSSGSIIVDNYNINEDLKSWRNKCGYVPQNISLLNDSISGNIAFGVEKAKVEKDKIKYCIEISGLSDFVESLEEKENTFIGENGLAISGGQRQRLAIARALYRNPDIIFFDEATSALDKTTEAELMKSITNLKGKITIIFISHNESIYNHCDEIINLDKS